MRIPATLLSSITHRRPTTVPTQVQARLLSRTFTIGSYLSSQAQQGNNNIVSKMPSDVQNEVESLIKDNFVMVFSKSHCPYCSATKRLFSETSLDTGKSYKVIELDERDDGSLIQQHIAKIHGQRTVPQVFINGEFIGGNSDVQSLKGKALNARLKAAAK